MSNCKDSNTCPLSRDDVAEQWGCLQVSAFANKMESCSSLKMCILKEDTNIFLIREISAKIGDKRLIRPKKL